MRKLSFAGCRVVLPIAGVLFIASPFLCAQDLVLAKATNPPGQATVRAGDTLVYRVTATNLGPGMAMDVAITDQLFDVFVPDPQPSAGGNCVVTPIGLGFAAEVTCTWAGATAVSEVRSVDLTVRACSEDACGSTLISDSALVTSTTEDVNQPNNAQTGIEGGAIPPIVTTVQSQAEFGLSVESDAPTVMAGGQVTYSIDVENNGPSNAMVTLVDALPAGWTVATVTSENLGDGICSGMGTGTATCAFALNGSFICAPLQQPGTITVVADVPPDAGSGDAINTVEISSDNCLPDLGTTLVTETVEVMTETPPFELHFAQFGNGQGLQSDIILSNPSSLFDVTGTLFFFDGEGGELTVPLQGGDPADSVEFSIPPLGTTRVSTTGDGVLGQGSASLTASRELGGVIRFTIDGRGTAGVGSSAVLNGATTPVRQVPGGIRTGVAVRNLDEQTITVQLALRTNEGDPVANATRSIPLLANGRFAMFVDEIFPNASLTAFEGALIVESEGRIAVITLELGPQAGQFTALPVTPLSEADVLKR